MQQSVDHSHHFNPSIDEQFSHEVSFEDVNILFLTLERCVQMWYRYEDEVKRARLPTLPAASPCSLWHMIGLLELYSSNHTVSACAAVHLCTPQLPASA